MRSVPKYQRTITPGFIRLLGISSVLHDIGKVGLEDTVLLKPGKLTRKPATSRPRPSTGSNHMLGLRSLAAKIFGTTNDRKVAKYQDRVAAINAAETEVAALSDEDLKARTALFRQEISAGKSLDEVLVPAFATVREAARRTLGQRHFDVQLIGGMALHEGRIAEMKTGEGKTLFATLAVYLNALAGKGVHVVTVNDYLARRDADWMGQIYAFLGLTTGVIVHGLDDAQRRQIGRAHV